MLTDNTAATTDTSGADNTTTATDSGAAATGQPQVNEFVSSLPESFHSNELVSGFENAEGLAQSYVDLNTKYSELQGKVPVIPDSPANYEVTAPEGYNAPEGSLDGFLQFAHEKGMTKEQVEGLLAFDHQRAQQANQAAIDRETEAVNGLKQEWGVNFDANVEAAKRAVERIGGAELQGFLDESRLGNNPHMVKMFANIAKAISEDTMLTGGANTQPKKDNIGPNGRPIINFPSMGK